MARKDWKEKRAKREYADERLAKMYQYMERNYRNDKAKEEFHRPAYGHANHEKKEETEE